MSPRIIIAGQTGIVIGLIGFTLYLSRQQAQLRAALDAASLPAPELPAGTNQRPVRLRLQQLPPIQIRSGDRAFDWRRIEAEDYPTYITNLRSIGCPEETIRDIIVADINKLFDARRAALQPPAADWEFWRHPDEIEVGAEARAAEAYARTQTAALERERRRLIRSLLGEGAVQAEFDDLLATQLRDRTIQFLPEEKRGAVAEALARWKQALWETDALDGEVGRSAAESAAQQQLQEALSTLLTPEELEQYALRTSPTAQRLREELRGFHATREEFEALFRLERQFESELAGMDSAESTSTGARRAREEAVRADAQDQLQSLLGPDRYAEYQRTRDADYQTLYGLAKLHDVPTGVANQVWEMRHVVEQQSERVRANPLLTIEQKELALAAIRSETQAAIVDVLGEPLLDAYQQQGGGWLYDLTAPVNLGVSGQPIVPPPLPPVDLTPAPGLTPGIPFP